MLNFTLWGQMFPNYLCNFIFCWIFFNHKELLNYYFCVKNDYLWELLIVLGNLRNLNVGRSLTFFKIYSRLFKKTNKNKNLRNIFFFFLGNLIGLLIYYYFY